MKVNNRAIYLVVMLLAFFLFVSGCFLDNVTPMVNGEERYPVDLKAEPKTSVQANFSMSVAGNSVSQEPAYLIITVRNKELADEITDSLPIINFGEEYICNKAMFLKEGLYDIEKFWIYNEDGEVIWVAVSHELPNFYESFVNKTLPSELDVRAGAINTTTFEVVPVDQGTPASEYGYAGFKFSNNLFYLRLLVFDPENQKTDAVLDVTVDGVRSVYNLIAGLNSIPLNRSLLGIVSVNVNKPGYRDFIQNYTKDELMLLFETRGTVDVFLVSSSQDLLAQTTEGEKLRKSWWDELNYFWQQIFTELGNDAGYTKIDDDFYMYILQLKEIDLTEKGLTDLSGLKKLFLMEKLNISKNPEITTLQEIQYLAYLQELNVSYTSITNLSALGVLDNLTRLSCTNTFLENCEEFINFKNLVYFNSDSSLVSDVSGLGCCYNLESLSMHSNRLTSITGLENLNNLKSIDLRYNKIESIAGLPTNPENINYLGLSGNCLTELDGIQGCTNLTTLNLDNNQLTNLVGIENFRKLTEIYLQYNKLTDLYDMPTLSTTVNVFRVDHNELQVISGLKISKIIEFYCYQNNIWYLQDIFKYTKKIVFNDNPIYLSNTEGKLKYVEEIFCLNTRTSLYHARDFVEYYGKYGYTNIVYWASAEDGKVYYKNGKVKYTSNYETGEFDD